MDHKQRVCRRAARNPNCKRLHSLALTLKCELRVLIDERKTEYYLGLSNSIRREPRKQWKIINDLTGRTRISGGELLEIVSHTETLSEPQYIAGAFNEYFVDVPRRIASHLGIQGFMTVQARFPFFLLVI